MNAHYEDANDDLLSMQSDSEPVKRADKDWQLLRSHLEQKLYGLRTWRQTWWSGDWYGISQYILPRRSIHLTQSSGGIPTPNNMTRGRAINTQIVDPTAQYCLRVLSAGLMSGLASPSRPWFKIVPWNNKSGISSEIRQWIDAQEDVVYSYLASSNFYNAFAQECEDLPAYGTAVTIIYEDKDEGFRIQNPAIGEFYLSADATGRINGLYRMYVMTVEQIVGFFGSKNLPASVGSLWNQKKSGLNTEFTIAHSIEPNYAIDGIGKIPGNFAYREVFWVWGQSSDIPLSMRGFVEKPFTASRWSTQSNDAYGRGPGSDILPDVKQLQVMVKRRAEGIEKQVRPPLLADMAMKNMPSSILPGDITYVPNLGPNTGIRPIYTVTPDLNAMQAGIGELQQRISRGLFNDLFMMLENLQNQRMTAYEVAQRMQEKMQVLGPVIESLINESLKPKLQRIYSMLKRKGKLPPPPQGAESVDLDIEFVSMLALAQKATATGGLERISGLIGNLYAVFPEVADNLDVDAYIQEFNLLLGNPQKILVGPEILKQKRDARAKQQQQMQQQQAMSHGVQTAKVGADAANVLANTKVGAGADALSQILSGGQ